MITRRALMATPLLAAPLAGCIAPEYRTRYRLTISGIFEGRPVSGDSVMESVLSDPNHWWTGGILIARYRGEATILNLDANRVLVATMRQWNPGHGSEPFLSYEPGWRPNRALIGAGSVDDHWKGGRNSAEERLSRLKTSAPTPVAPESLPAMVVFENRHDPNSIRLLPYGRIGPVGFSLTRASVEITRDRIFTDKPVETFPWLANYSDRIDIGQGVYATDIVRRKLSR